MMVVGGVDGECPRSAVAWRALHLRLVLDGHGTVLLALLTRTETQSTKQGSSWQC